MTWRGLATTACVALGACGLPLLAQERTLVGYYRCEGQQGGQPYVVPLQVLAFGQTYRLEWGQPAHLFGLGVLSDGRLAVAIVAPSTGAIGVALYQVTAGRLSGIWSRGDSRVDVETCVVPAGREAQQAPRDD